MASIHGGVIAALAVVMLMVAGLAMVCTPVAAEDFRDDVALDSSGSKPDVARDGQGNVYAVYPRYEGGPIYCSRSVDSGQTFQSPIQVSETGQMPAVAVDDDSNVHVVFGQNYKIYHTVSADQGINFGTPAMVSDDLGADWLHDNPAIAAQGDDVYVCWETWRAGSAASNISFDASIDGNGFGEDGTVNTVAGVLNGPPSVDVDDDGTIAVAWQDDRSGTHAYVARSTSQGNSFTAGVQVDSSEGAHHPSVAIHDGVCYVAYQTFSFESGEGRLMCAVGSGSSFTVTAVGDVPLSNGDVTTFLNDIAVHPCGKIFVVWQDSRNGNEGEIYFAASKDGGTTFSSDVRVNDDPPAESYNGHTHPAIAVGADTEVYVAWQDKRTGQQPFFAAAPDRTPPAPVDNLQVTGSNTTTITVEWTAPGDNLDMGTAELYDIRYSTTEITDATWDDATLVAATPTPQTAGATETVTLSNLSPDTTYYVAIKTNDEIPNLSELSNVASGSTTGDGNGDTPGFEAVLVMLAAGLLLLTHRRRLKS